MKYEVRINPQKKKKVLPFQNLRYRIVNFRLRTLVQVNQLNY